MNSKTILAISFAAVFAVSMIYLPNAIADDDDNGSHLQIVKSKYKVNENGLAKLTIKTDGDIPTNGQAGAFGYGVITGFSSAGPENVLAITTHMCAADHPLQGPNGNCPDGTIGVLTQATLGGLINENHDGAEMHAHILDLKDNTPECNAVTGNIGLEVDIVRTVEGLGLPGVPVPDDPEFPNNNLLAGSTGGYDISIDDEKLKVKRIPSSDLFDTEALAIVAFGIFPLTENPDDPTFITNLCLTDGSTNPVPSDDDDDDEDDDEDEED